MGGRGAGTGRTSGAGAGITDRNELIRLYNSISNSTSYTVDEKVRAMSDIRKRIDELDKKNK